jgi:hypothetical protein
MMKVSHNEAFNHFLQWSFVAKALANDTAVAAYLSRNRQLRTYDETPEEAFSAKLRTLALRTKQYDFERARRDAYEGESGIRSAYPDLCNVPSLLTLYIRLQPLQRYLLDTKLWKPWTVKGLIGHRIEVRDDYHILENLH